MHDLIGTVETGHHECAENKRSVLTIQDVRDNEWHRSEENEPVIEKLQLRERRQYRQSLAPDATAYAASSSSPMSTASARTIKSSAPTHAAFDLCSDFCAIPARRCMRICIGFSIQIRGMCRSHCMGGARACLRGCAATR